MPPIGTRPQPRQVEFDTARAAVEAGELLFRFGIDVFISPRRLSAPVEHDVWIVEARL